MNYIYNMTIIKSTLLTKIKSPKNKEVQKQSSINYIPFQQGSIWIIKSANEDVIQCFNTSFQSIPQTGLKQRDDFDWQEDDDSLMISGLD